MKGLYIKENGKCKKYPPIKLEKSFNKKSDDKNG